MPHTGTSEPFTDGYVSGNFRTSLHPPSLRGMVCKQRLSRNGEREQSRYFKGAKMGGRGGGGKKKNKFLIFSTKTHLLSFSFDSHCLFLLTAWCCSLGFIHAPFCLGFKICTRTLKDSTQIPIYLTSPFRYLLPTKKGQKFMITKNLSDSISTAVS